MYKRTASSVVVVALSLLAGCDKASSPGSAGTTSELFKSLPAGANIVIGGNFMRMQKFMADSMTGGAMMDAMDKMSKGMKDWSECFMASKNLDFAGSVTFAGGPPKMSMVMTGFDIPEVSACAAKAGFKATPDADGKYIAIELPQPTGTINQGYLKLPNGALYFHQVLSPVPQSNARVDLEADVASLAKGSVLDDPKLKALAAKPDHSKTMWFAGTAAGTPVADKVGDVYGTMDFDKGIALDVTAQVTDPAIAQKVEDGLAQAKKMADQLPPDLKDVVTGVELKRDGDKIHVTAKASEQQISAFMKTAGPMLGGGAAAH